MMLEYTEKEIIKTAAQILENDELKITPVGNHHLKRHLVYHLTDREGLSLIFKLYYKSNRWNREVATLKILKDSNIKAPLLYNYGKLDDGTEWIMTQHIDGYPLVDVIEILSHQDKLNIFQEMGEQLGQLHTFKEFEFFGNWNENGQILNKDKNYYGRVKQGTEKMIEKVLNAHYPEIKLHKNAANVIRNNYHLIADIKEFHLCHNDFDDRNVLVRKEDGKWKLAAVIDFEQSYPGNKDIDFTSLYQKFFLDHQYLEKAFLSGYQEYSKMRDDFKDRLDFYLLRTGMSICSFAYTQAPDYYQRAVALLERILDKK